MRVPSEPRLPRPCRGAPAEGRAEGPSPLPKLAPFLCNSKLIHSKGLSAPVSPVESALTDTSRIFRISLKINGCQVLYNQHLRVFPSQVLYIQHLHKNMGGGEGGPKMCQVCARSKMSGIPPAAQMCQVCARSKMSGIPPAAPPVGGIFQPQQRFGNRAPRSLTVLLFFVRANYSAPRRRSWQT
jgi:hypothetical protein